MATDRVHLLLYRTLLLTTAVVALAMGVVAGLDAPHITPEYQLTGYWRAYGLLVFAALAAYLGAAPPGAGVLWLVVVFHKASMTMTAVLLLRHDVTGAPVAAVIDGAIVLATLIALGLRIPAARAATAAHDARVRRVQARVTDPEQPRPLRVEKSLSSSPEALAPSPASRPTPGPAPRPSLRPAPRPTPGPASRPAPNSAPRTATRPCARPGSDFVDPNPNRGGDRRPDLHRLPA